MSRESGASYYFKNMQAQGLTSVAENTRASANHLRTQSIQANSA